MNGKASQEDRLSKLHFDPNVFSVTIEDIRQHAGGQNVLANLFPREAATAVKAAQDAFIKNASAVVDYTCRSMRISSTLKSLTLSDF